MVSWIISRLVVLVFGTLYPAYSSYKAVKTKNVKEYVKWMMYWIVFAFFTTAETLTDIILSWFPFYFELKIAFVIWLLSPYTKGSSVLYRKFVHPTLSNKEKGQGVLSEKLRSFSMQDLTLIRDDDTMHLRSPESNMHTSAKGHLETIDDSGASYYSSSEDMAVSQRHNGTQSDSRTEPSDDDTGDKVPKRTQSLKAPKKIIKTEPPQKVMKARPKKKATGSTTVGESA
ncbi:receptor expression-enhancing protein 2 isoform 2-T2 [Liasis olivaceus]